MKNICSIPLIPGTATPNQRASWLPASTLPAASSCKTSMISVIQRLCLTNQSYA